MVKGGAPGRTPPTQRLHEDVAANRRNTAIEGKEVSGPPANPQKVPSAKNETAAEAGTSRGGNESLTAESYGNARPSATIIPFPRHRIRKLAPPALEPWRIDLALALDCLDELWSRELDFVLSLLDLDDAGRLHDLSPRQEAWLAAIVHRLELGGGYV